ncbi:MAG: 2TM domain-containing protein [Candidatus Marinimicrobia bacterium]|nr:2TM domain-containing protein [Candidatus Neomarinimicrobiota bacterium]
MFSRNQKVSKEEKKGLKIHLTVTILVSLLVTSINFISPVKYLWCKWPIIGMSLSMVFHAAGVYYLPKIDQN